MRIAKYMLIGVLALLGRPALAGLTQDRDLTVQQESVAQASVPRPGSIQVSVTTDRQDATFAIGETVHLTVGVSEDAYVTVLDVGPTGQVVQLFPNRFQTDNRVYAGRPVEIAGAGSGAKITVGGPVGAELIKVIASSKPVAVVAERQLQGHGVFRSVEGGAATVLKDLQVAADEAGQNDNKIALANFTLHTVGGRLAPAPGQQTLVIVPGPGVAPAPTTLLPVTTPQAAGLINVPAQQLFPLLIAVDKPAYRIGEKVTLAVTSLQACNLTVLDVTPAGQVRTLFPSQSSPNNAVAANQTVLVAGGSSSVSLNVVGPVGTEQILAICSTDTAPVVQPGGDRAALFRDLAVVANRPAGSTATASVAFAVQQ